MIRIAAVACVSLLGCACLRAQEDKGTISYDEARKHEIKPHRRSIPQEGISAGFNQLRLTLTVSPVGFVTHAEASGDPKSMNHWPQLQGEIEQWKFTPFLKDGHPVAATVEEYVDLVPPERLPTKHVTPPVLRPDSKVTITLERSGCFGSCPAYIVTASTDGLTFEGSSSVVATGRHTAQVDSDAVRKLAKEFIADDFYSMAPIYRAGVTDNPTYRLSITVDGNRKEVIDYVGEWEGMPAVVTTLEQEVDEFAGTKRWIEGTPRLAAALQSEKWDFATYTSQQMLKGASQRGQAETVRDLLAAGVPLKPIPASAPADGTSTSLIFNAGWLQAASGNADVLKALIGAGASKDDQADKDLGLSNAASYGDISAVRALIAYGADPNADLSKLTMIESGGGMTVSGPGAGSVLIYAAASGNPEVVREILKYKPQLESRGYEGKTAIFSAAEYGRDASDEDRVESVRLLAEAGANVNAHDSDGNTPLHETFLVQVIEELIALGANVNARNKDGETPIFTNVSAEAMAVFAAHGADFTVRNKEGQTVIEAAKSRGPAMTEALLAAMRTQSAP